MTNQFIRNRSGAKEFTYGDGELFNGGFDDGEAEDGEHVVNLGAKAYVVKALAIVRDTFYWSGACPAQPVTSNDVSAFLARCADRPEDYHKLLRTVKELQELYRQYDPHYRGVMLYPLVRKTPFIRLPNKAFVAERGTADWREFFDVHGRMVGEGELRHKFTPQFEKIYTLDEKGSFEGGILTDGFSFYSYAKRGANVRQRTEAQTAADLRANKERIVAQLNRPATFWTNVTMHHSGKERRVVRPYDPEDNFTGIISLEELVKATNRDPELLTGRAVLFLDAGKKRAVAGHVVCDGVRYKSFHVSGRELFAKTGRDRVEKSGKRTAEALLEKFPNGAAYAREFERAERASGTVQFNHVNVEQLIREQPFLNEQNVARAKAKSSVPLEESKCFEAVLERIVMTLEAVVKETGSTKKPFVIIGDHYGPSKGARGARGDIAAPLIKYLAQFLLLVTVPEHNTTKLCPLCHCETKFANKREIRSKVCKSCPVAGKDFFYDRDYGAASNLQFKAEFFVRSGGYYPAQYITVKERKRRAKLFDTFMRDVFEARGDSSDAGGSAVKTRSNSASAVKSQ